MRVVRRETCVVMYPLLVLYYKYCDVVTPLRTCVSGAADVFTDGTLLDHTRTVVVRMQRF